MRTRLYPSDLSDSDVFAGGWRVANSALIRCPVPLPTPTTRSGIGCNR
jgi:hypothetical protein